MRRVTLDTNIYISALQFGGSAAELLQLALDGEIEVAISQPIIEETLRVLREKFGWQQASLEGALAVIQSCTQLVNASGTLNVVPCDPDDNRILECAVTAKSEVIVTGDRDLLQISEYGGIRIIRIREFLEQMAH